MDAAIPAGLRHHVATRRVIHSRTADTTAAWDDGGMTRTVRGARVLITGAASGMGRLYAERAVREGARAVVLWDRDEEALAVVVAELRAIVIDERSTTAWGAPGRSPSSA